MDSRLVVSYRSASDGQSGGLAWASVGFTSLSAHVEGLDEAPGVLVEE